MDLNIYFLLFGIIVTFANGKPTSDETFLIASENELQSLLKNLYNDGKFDIAFSHQEDGPKIHHVDKARFTAHENHHHHHHPSSHEAHSRGSADHHGNHKHTNVEEHPSLTNIQTLNLFYKRKPKSGQKQSDSSGNEDNDIITNILGLGKKNIARSVAVNNEVDEVLDFLKQLDNKIDDDRCEGDRCARTKDCVDDRCENNVRSGDNRDCQGDRCGRATMDRACSGSRCDDDRVDCVGDRCDNDRDDNYCVGNRCDRPRNAGRADNDCRDERCIRSRLNNLRCSGDRCGRDRDDDDRACVGDRCGRDRDDDDRACVGDRCGRDRDDDDRACVGDRCGRDRDDDDRACIGDRCGRDRDDDDRACVGDRCGRNIDDDDIKGNLRCSGDRCENDRACDSDRCGRATFIDDDEDDDSNNLLRCNRDGCNRDAGIWCNGKRCSKLRSRRLPKGDEHVKQHLSEKPLGNKIKINDNLDAIVFDLTDLEKTLGKPQLKQINDNQPASLKLIPNVELDNLLDVDRGLMNSHKPIEAVVVDLGKANDLSKEINAMVTNLQIPLKTNNNMLKNSPPKPPGESKILSHNEDNNNVYVPQWLLDEVASKTASKMTTNTNIRDPVEQAFTNALTLTPKQKEKLLKAISTKNAKPLPARIFRRSIDDIGVPFHLEIQGLGQVNP